MKRLPFFIFTLIFFMFLFSYCGEPSRPSDYSFTFAQVTASEQNVIKIFLNKELGRSKLSLNEDYNVLLVEKWNEEAPVITVWLGEINTDNKNIIEKAAGRKTENAQKYDPLSKNMVTGTDYEIDAFISVFLFEREGKLGFFAKITESFISKAALNETEGIFFNTQKYRVGSIGSYDDWRPAVN